MHTETLKLVISEYCFTCRLLQQHRLQRWQGTTLTGGKLRRSPIRQTFSDEP